MKKLRIAVWHNLPAGGGKRQLYYHIRGLVERGHYVEAWCPDTADREFLPLSDIVKENVILFKPSGDMRNFNSKDYGVVRELLNAIEKNCRVCADQINSGDFDVLFANSCLLFRTNPMAKYVNIPSMLYLNEPYRQFYEAMPELPWIAPKTFRAGRFSLQGLLYYIKRLHTLDGIALQAREELEFARSFDLILVNSVFSRESVLRAFNLESKVCYLGIDTDHYRPSGEMKEKYVIGIGYIYHGKGIDRAIRALATIRMEKRPPLMWIGNSASQHDLQTYIDLAVSLNVDFVPKIHISDSEVISLLSRASAMIYAPRLEPFGFAPLEANACGTAVVAIAEGGIKETMVDGVNGFLTNDDDPEMLGRLICKFIDDPMFAQQMGLEAREHVLKHWDMEFCTDNIESHLIRLATEDSTRIKRLIAKKSLLEEIEPTDDIKMNIEECKHAGQELFLKGWAYIDDGNSAFDSEIFVVLKNALTVTVIKADKIVREDVTAHFGGKVNYDDSGFVARIINKPAGVPKVGILIHRREKISLQFRG